MLKKYFRNTVDSLTIIRQLKEKGIECFFEKEQIWTFDGKGELLLTIMSSLAQEESRSISENVQWGQRKRMQDGKITLPYKQFLGYEKDEDGLPKIVESEAKIIRFIYTLFLQGKTVNAIDRERLAEDYALIIQARAGKRESISRFISDLERCGGLLTEFDEALWCEIVDSVTVHSESDIAVIFKNGSEVLTCAKRSH